MISRNRAFTDSPYLAMVCAWIWDSEMRLSICFLCRCCRHADEHGSERLSEVCRASGCTGGSKGTDWKRDCPQIFKHRRLSPIGNFVHHDGSAACFNVNICVYLSEMIRALELLLWALGYLQDDTVFLFFSHIFEIYVFLANWPLILFGSLSWICFVSGSKFSRCKLFTWVLPTTSSYNDKFCVC